MSASVHYYRVECWSQDGETLLETISLATDHIVSCAAWQAALRRRPGMLLIHKNGNHTMEKTVAPGEKVADPATIAAGSTHAHIDAALRDLRHWHRLRVHCYRCMRHVYVDVEQLKRKVGGDTLFGTLERRLTCKSCGGRSVRLEVFNERRD